MGSVRPTLYELGAQVTATSAMELADAFRDDRDEYHLWIRAAASANERTRLSMTERGVKMFTRIRSVNK